MDIPESPEGIALFLLAAIISREPLSNLPAKEVVLGLYRECLQAVIGGEIERLH